MYLWHIKKFSCKFGKNRCIFDNFGFIIVSIFVSIPTKFRTLLSNLHPYKQLEICFIHNLHNLLEILMYIGQGGGHWNVEYTGTLRLYKHVILSLVLNFGYFKF